MRVKIKLSVQEVPAPWRRRQHGPPKRLYPTTTLHDVTTQKTSTWSRPGGRILTVMCP